MLLKTDFNISKLTSFKIGGNIHKVFSPKTIDEFVEILQNNPDAKVFGNLSNTLISSYGYSGTVILTGDLNDIKIDGETIIAQCGVKGPRLAQFAMENALSGFEFMIGFPGSVGGNICMNASANAQCISDNLIKVLCYKDGNIIELFKSDMDFSYRHSLLSENQNIYVLSAEFVLEKCDRDLIEKRMQENLDFRKLHQPLLSLPNCGSVFKNPQGDSAGRLLDSVGAKSMSCGGAKVWENHANFIVNTGDATSADVLNLMYMMSSSVEEEYGIKLIPEMKFLGGSNENEDKLWEKLR